MNAIPAGSAERLQGANAATDPDHPLKRKHRPVMTTPPILTLANAIRTAMEDGHQGLRVLGSGRVGKTYAQRWLIERKGWHVEPLACVSVRVTRHSKIKDGYINQLILMSCRQKLSARLSDLDTLSRVRNLFEELCYAAGSNTLLLLVDESQRLYQEELSDFLTIVNESEAWDIDVFVVFFQQTDVTGTESERVREQFAPHIKGRFGMADFHFYGPRGEVETAAVLKRYDENAKWPIGSETTYTAYFAPAAFASGWRLVQHTKEIREVVGQLRAAHGLGPLDEWPMKTFELFVQRILTRIVVRPGFTALTRADIEEALDASGYIPFEFCRANLIDDEDD